MQARQILIIRFSSFGDLFQALEAAAHLRREADVERIGWLVREDFAALLKNQSYIDEVHAFSRKQTVFSLIQLAWRLAGQYDAFYDAHSNLRSAIARWTIRTRHLLKLSFPPFAIRSKERLRRFLFFRFRMPTLPMPYRGAESYLLPLRKWFPDLTFDFTPVNWKPTAPVPSDFQSWRAKHTGRIIGFAPSAAWPNKRWPVERWGELARKFLSEDPKTRFVLLGGPEDTFLNKIAESLSADQVFNAVGRTSLSESASLIAECDAVVANDTGLLHVADRLQKPSVAIIGPTAFGYTVSPFSRTAEVDRAVLLCKPCSKDGRDPCTNAVHLKCLKDVSIGQVALELAHAFEGAPK